jgi:hypothetical protein
MEDEKKKRESELHGSKDSPNLISSWFLRELNLYLTYY